MGGRPVFGFFTTTVLCVAMPCQLCLCLMHKCFVLLHGIAAMCSCINVGFTCVLCDVFHM
jgi:hypothetical protein